MYAHKLHNHWFMLDDIDIVIFCECIGCMLISCITIGLCYIILGHSGQQTPVKCAGACGSTFRRCACAF